MMVTSIYSYFIKYVRCNKVIMPKKSLMLTQALLCQNFKF